MLGSALKLSAQTNTTGQNSTDFYYPRGLWCNVFNTTDRCFQSPGKYYTKRTKAYDFYLHLREGYIIPMQNATAANINTTAQLQDLPVDFHILGSLNADGQSWAASGSYYNDNGTVLNITDNYNKYTISASGSTSDPTAIRVTVQPTVLANNYQGDGNCSAVNMNDYLGGLQIYNGQNLGLTNDYYVIGRFLNNTEALVGEAHYSSYTDRVVMDAPIVPVCLTAVTELLFTKKAI